MDKLKARFVLISANYSALRTLVRAPISVLFSAQKNACTSAIEMATGKQKSAQKTA
jgi:hypothetical protein